MKRWSPVFATASLLCVFAQAAPVEVRAESSVTLTPALSERIDDLAREQIHAGRTPGLAIGIVADGRIVYARGFGFSSLGKHVSMAPDTQFYVGGLTREFTAAAVLLLAQENKLSLADKLRKYVPEFKAGSAIAVGQLLTQTSGLPPYDPKDPTKTVAAHQMMVLAARRKDEGGQTDVEAGMAKYLAAEYCKEVVEDAFRIHGGYGYSTEYEIERLYRDAPMLLIGEGTSEIQKMIIGQRIVSAY